MTASEPEIIARGLIVEEGRVLVCRNLAKGYAYLPGGHIEAGETAAAALAREFDEECGVAITVGDAALVAELVTGPDDGGLHEYTLVFHVERSGDDPVTSREPHISFEWMDLGAMVDADLRPSCIKAWIASGGSTSGPDVAFVSGV
ncbi:MAG: NUDIX domain-containing protein [Planctomycetota bacterium]